MSWKLLHLMTAFVPEQLSEQDETEANQFLKLLYL